MSHTSDFGSDRIDQADASQQLLLADALRNNAAPLEYRILYVKNGEELTDTFRSVSGQRADTMRSLFGIDADNDKWALQTRKTDGRWSEPIGNKILGAKLKTQR